MGIITQFILFGGDLRHPHLGTSGSVDFIEGNLSLRKKFLRNAGGPLISPKESP